MGNHDGDAGLDWRVLLVRIAASASDTDTQRAERLLLRGLARQWPEQRLCKLLAALQRSLPSSAPESTR